LRGAGQKKSHACTEDYKVVTPGPALTGTKREKGRIVQERKGKHTLARGRFKKEKAAGGNEGKREKPETRSRKDQKGPGWNKN